VPEVTDSRSWWLKPTQKKSYPALSVMALDILSIPAISAEPERLFSSAKISITDRRNRLGIESIKAIECLKSWFSKSSTIAFADNTINTRLSDTDGDVL
jgi:hypothetical protein